ncbi:uncharacterized protein RAG0_02466 [Rhynchosporium agropyri]|uniref:Uncharacterized protein n=1 Tax=Rhynchosporium agropyri TaxID=914238 RepID=A0A1E1K214_9HELO|nr:uncharacterized protein RAG0_02466 [Rhynchosporium agropyri]
MSLRPGTSDSPAGWLDRAPPLSLSLVPVPVIVNVNVMENKWDGLGCAALRCAASDHSRLVLPILPSTCRYCTYSGLKYLHSRSVLDAQLIKK